MHVLHPLLIWREAKEELETPDFWSNYDIPEIVGGATMLEVRNAGLALRQRQQQQQQQSPIDVTQPTDRFPSAERGRAPKQPSIIQRTFTSETVRGEDTAPLSTSLETVRSGTDSPGTLATADPIRLQVSLSGMIATSVALRSGLEVDIVDAPPEWAATLFPFQPRTRSPSRSGESSQSRSREGSTGEPSPRLPLSEKGVQGDEALPKHVAQAIASLQRETLLLKNELNLELWTARENVVHIGRLYKERVLSRNEEVERQGLVRSTHHRVMLAKQEAEGWRSTTN